MKLPHRIAVPIAGGRFCAHFGRSDAFLLGDADLDASTVSGLRRLARPTRPGDCESVPHWLRSPQSTGSSSEASEPWLGSAWPSWAWNS